MAVGVAREVVERYISEVAPHGLVIACVNSPSSVTVSGDLAAINELGKKLSNAKVFARKLKVNVAYHSHHTKRLEFDYLRALQKGLEKRGIRDLIYSSPVTGNIIPGREALPPEHWTQNMLQPVLFLGLVVETIQSLVCFLTGKGYQLNLDRVNFPGSRGKLEVLTDLPS